VSSSSEEQKEVDRAPESGDGTDQQTATIVLPGEGGAKVPPAPISITELDQERSPQPAVPERPSVSPSAAHSRGGDTSKGTQGPTPLETLHVEEIARTRVFLRVAVLVACAVAASAPFLGSDPSARRLMYSAVVLVVVGCGWLAWQLRDDAGYTEGRVRLTAWICVAGALTGIYFYGTFSPAPVVVPFGLYFFALSRSFRATAIAWLSCAGGYALLVLAEVGGFIADRGVVPSSTLPAFDRLTMMGIVESIFAATFFIARATRQASLTAIEQHDRVLRSLGQRDALLKEARQDLERALQVGGVGRFTDDVLGSYRLGTVLGRGAMGEVYEGTHVVTGAPAAVKLLQPHLLQDPESVRRFLREAKLVAAIRVPQVVEVFEIGGLDADIPFIAMERLRGEDLADHLRRHRRLSMRRTVKLVRDLARGLDAARVAGIVHRDLKPRNVCLAESDGKRPVWKILDFGVSRLASASTTLTTDRVIGSPAYMAPEQARGAAVTHQADVHALGVICYRALTGRPAFVGRDVPETLYAVVHAMPPAPSVQVPSLPEEIDWVLALALAKDPKDRFATALQLADALESATRGELDEALASRARRLIEQRPWGEVEATQDG
jgi:serine/threonine-protein kinase